MKTCFFASVIALVVSGCCSKPPVTTNTPRNPSIILYSRPLPAAAPPTAKRRCESLPPVSFSAGAVSNSVLISEIQKARSAYADCANRHNVLVDFEGKLEKGFIDIYNHYQQQAPK